MSTELGSSIRAERARKGLSQEALAKKIDRSKQTIYNWERGEGDPNWSDLLALSRVFGRPWKEWAPDEEGVEA